MECYSVSIQKIRAENELRLFNLLSYIFPAHSDEEVKLRNKLVKILEVELGEQEEARAKTMSVMDFAKMFVADGIPVEIIQDKGQPTPSNQPG